MGRPARGTETLLLVEDNDAVRELSVRAFEDRGYTVYDARSGEEAIDWLVSVRHQAAPAHHGRGHARRQRP